MNTNELIQIASEAGKIILENGGETYRVEETIYRICSAYGEPSVESFVTPTGIVISISSSNNKNISIVKRIHKRSVNLEKIKRVNELSRAVSCNWMSLAEFKYQLNKINDTPRYSDNTSLLFASLAASCFTLLFGGNFRDALVSLVIGASIYKISSLLGKYKVNDFFINALGGALAGLIAVIGVKLNIGVNLDKIIIGSIMLLVPGLAITNAIRDTISGDFVSGVARAVEAFLVAIAIAIGSGTILKILFKFGGV